MTAPRLMREGPAPAPGIVHLGPGAFFRAFNAVYTHDAMQAETGDWGIVAVSLRSTTARDQLGPQGGVFTATTLSPQGRKAQVIGAVVDVLVAPEDPAQVIAQMASKQTRIVSLTITEKGYCHAPSTGNLDLDHPDIAHDLENLDAPRSAVGLIVAALRQRHANDLAPFTVLSCDNLPSNGRVIRQVTLDFARRIDPALAGWIAQHGAFPCTMVDRITPATTGADIEQLEQSSGWHDPGCVVHEPFRQWVIEDTFTLGRPAWHLAGAQFVADVDAHETMKLRCLNGTHSCLAYLGLLAGYQTVFEAVSDPDIAAFCEHLWTTEIIPTLTQPEGEDLATYAERLMQRYKNPGIVHRTAQIAMDGSQKLPQRLLAPISERLQKGHLPRGLILGVAAWMRHLQGADDAGNPIRASDPLLAQLSLIAHKARSSEALVDEMLGIESIFGKNSPENKKFRAELIAAHAALANDGALAAVKFAMASTN